MINVLLRISAWGLRRWSNLAGWWESQRWPMRLYSGGGIVILISLACTVIRLTYWDLHLTIFIIGTLLLASGILLEGYHLANKGMATRPGKILAALVATMIGALSMGMSSVIINQATGFPPSEFPYTVAFLAPLTAGHVILLLTVLLFIVASVLILASGTVSIWQALRQPDRKVDREYIQMMTRLLAAITLFSLIISGWKKQHEPYESHLNSVAGWFVYTFEMYSNDGCVQRLGERIHHAGPGEVFVGYRHEGRAIFFKRRCTATIFE
ncbi:hypothetical protein [Luteimonas kalidii]|uniref:Uncharacterized protein n=1 Tax=Luteimonas kalidii TaxID=3042025 RepID=A0ABT6JXU7_9GAMM|nr:hypothetical protein [Luteimonas kalidii]MDH5835318.1 hypothetical protein [Luteimonas kalidii]